MTWKMYTWKMRMTSSSSITQMMNSLSLSKCQSLQQKKSAVNNNSPFSEQLSPRLHDQQLLLGLTHLQFGWPSILIHRKKGAIQSGELKKAGFPFRCGHKTFRKRNFWETMMSLLIGCFGHSRFLSSPFLLPTWSGRRSVETRGSVDEK